MSLRIGQGFDVHAFSDDGDHVVLGGIRIPHERGLKAHSDGDVALHALSDALLGALALGDIGHYFPDTDPRWKGADSAVLLKAVLKDVTGRGWRPLNLDLTIICQQPKIAPHVQAMRERIADLMGLALDAVSVKATTTERLGFTGRGEGIAVQAVVLLERD
ncbi:MULTISPECIES: 2-C-methyl-D-erythritol 2,4-cyclodiphosphate synthase [Alloalcanivorax]|jgi:2-C-methyl-D-erythritol 2,4-cyclodiphosphate synthase|uniref:2-C-methyl-D-erythritol 2,4-cyclodiphosphate synthase n=1 Tax=Alloalcanivorax balearicus MACL04 TaxID=1177182 RepID=A0ABT2QYM1_9GAMM|nr:2-C-methyl-D-erythritol 2,4-cyclodiphosphate synthase [Alloalcanivorax xenomutans]ARB45585.1 2-C-methyl-D-erythritol 2,4-cyclodiphosphate synthase [Alloalcanivorax xenomutans]ERS14681.1 2-C-methyl-D-erythritol 2,4-cyclodiphosphate synthase [Alcanivorax sp. PN-3]MBA4720742.1 2-C-methyl-D-erythritol 2,4-cyclodiphosphate synthase [Alcanivorax sp.]MCU5782621.1 2-C-methyl-D-erythritol 2,4-cyclodiphosphate synthase [Alloalcanivorax balearicus MACL04]|tara:strand:+ start:817 stop:1299 length:483 start_codon:yes stop_codon:yes gene_type:complete